MTNDELNSEIERVFGTGVAALLQAERQYPRERLIKDVMAILSRLMAARDAKRTGAGLVITDLPDP